MIVGTHSQAPESARPADDAETSIESRDEAEAAVAIVAGLHLERDQAALRLNAAKMESNRHKEAVETIDARITRHTRRLEIWAREHRSELLPGDKRSLHLRQGTIGFRWSVPAVTFLEGWCEVSVLGKLRLVAKLRQYIRVREELNRQRILEDARPEVGKLDKMELKRLGLKVGREETFFVDPDFDQVTP